MIKFALKIKLLTLIIIIIIEGLSLLQIINFNPDICTFSLQTFDEVYNLNFNKDHIISVSPDT